MLEIVTEQRRSANRIVEECMIAANVAAIVLRDRLGFGVSTCTPVSILRWSSKRSPYCRPTAWKPKPTSC